MSPERVHTSARLRRGAAGLEFRTPRPPRRFTGKRLRLRRILRMLILLLFIGLLGEAIFALYHSPRFNLIAVEIQGAGPISEKLIRAKAPAPGLNLFALSEEAIAQNIQRGKSYSFLQKVEIKRRPPGILVIRVQERRAVAYLKQPWGRALLDKAGVVFFSPNPLPKALPELQGIELEQDSLGRPLMGEKAKALQEGLAALTKSPKLKLKSLVIDDRGGLTAQLEGGVELRLGEPENLEAKVNRAEIALSGPGKQTAAEYLDISAPEAPVWKPKGP